MFLLSLKVCFVIVEIHQILLQLSYCINLMLAYIDIIINIVQHVYLLARECYKKFNL